MKRKSKDVLLSFNFIRSCTREEVFKYIRKLHRIVRKQQKKLQRYKHKLRFLGKFKTPELEEEDNEKGEKEVKEVKEKAKTFLDEIKEAAESAQNKTDFIYEPTSGLYYDQRTGYYYNAEYGLYYDGTTGCYYRYDQEKNEFEFHSQVPAESTSDKTHVYPKTDEAADHCPNGVGVKRKRKTRAKYREDENYENGDHSENKDDVEDGEITSSSESEDDVIGTSDENGREVQSKYEDIAKRYPPSLRIIVQETNLPKLKVGTLFLITFKGGSLGREGDHDVVVPDVNISKFHLKFIYDESASTYRCIDLGSRNGTILNGKRMSTAKQESEPQKLVHGSILQLARTKLLCHIHSGNSTCGHCEPGLIISQQVTDKVVALTHKEQLKALQKRYGLENEKYVTTEKKIDPQYPDRAADRRDKVGSTNDYEKTEVASLETEISNTNKGFKLLSKLGWNKGDSLGKGQGLLEPIKLVNNSGRTGLGCEKGTISIPLTKKDKQKSESLRKTQERYKKSGLANIFVDGEESSD